MIGADIKEKMIKPQTVLLFLFLFVKEKEKTEDLLLISCFLVRKQ